MCLSVKSKFHLKSIAIVTATSTLEYTFKKSYSNMTVTSTFNGGTSYYSVFTNLENIKIKV